MECSYRIPRQRVAGMCCGPPQTPATFRWRCWRPVLSGGHSNERRQIVLFCFGCLIPTKLASCVPFPSNTFFLIKPYSKKIKHVKKKDGALGNPLQQLAKQRGHHYDPKKITTDQKGYLVDKPAWLTKGYIQHIYFHYLNTKLSLCISLS